jgi:hypothetical protein
VWGNSPWITDSAMDMQLDTTPSIGIGHSCFQDCLGHSESLKGCAGIIESD